MIFMTAGELYLIPFFIYVFSYMFLLLRKKRFYQVFISLIYSGFIIQSVIFFIWLNLRGVKGMMSVDWIVFFNAWIIMLVVILFNLFYKAKYILIYITPIVAINLLIGFFAPHVYINIKSIFSNFDQAILLTHIILILIGDSLFALAFIISLIYIFQERRIKIKKNLKLFDKKNRPFDEVFYQGKGYNLELLDSMNYQCLKIGFPLITVGIAMGIYLSNSLFKSFMIVKPIEIISLATWLIYAVLLHERVAKGLRGKKAAVFSIVGFLLIISSLSFSFYLFPEFHGFK